MAVAPARKAEAGITDHAREALAHADAAPSRARRAEAATAAPVDDYRQALGDGRFAEALQRLPAPATAAERMDRELLLWQQLRQPPRCAGDLGTEALLCAGLQRQAAGQEPAPDWRASLEASGLVSGPQAYRRALIDAVFGPRE